MSLRPSEEVHISFRTPEGILLADPEQPSHLVGMGSVPHPDGEDSALQVLVFDKAYFRKVEPLLWRGLAGIRELRSKDPKL